MSTTDDVEIRMAGGDDESQARQEAEATAEQVRHHAEQTRQTAKREASRVADEARAQTRSLLQQAQEVGTTRADEQAERLAGGLRTLSDQASALLEGRTEDAGALGDYARQLAEYAQQYADRIDELGFRGLVDETSRFARRRPGAFLAVAAGAGLLVGRLGRGAADADGGGSTSSSDRGDRGGVPAASFGAAAGAVEQVSEPVGPGEVRRQVPPPAPAAPAEGQAGERW